MSDHTQLLHDIEKQLEKLATAHTVLSDAIETEKRAGLVQAITKGVGVATRGAQVVGGAVKEHLTQAKEGMSMMGEGFMDASPRGKLLGVGAAGVIGASSTISARQEKQAEFKLDAVKKFLAKRPSKGTQGMAAMLASAQAGSTATNAVMNSGQSKQANESEHAGNPTHYLRSMAIGAGLLTAPALLRAKALKGVIANSESKIQSMAKEHRALLDHPNSALNAEPALFDENMSKVNDLTQRMRQEANTKAVRQRDDFGYATPAIQAAKLGAGIGATGEAIYSDHQNRDELYHPNYGRNMALTAGLVATAPGATLVELGIGTGGAALATKLNSMRHAYREKQASDESDNGGQVGKYITGGGVAGAALAAPDAVRGLKSLSKQKFESGKYDEARGHILRLNQDTNRLDMTSPTYQRDKAFNEEYVGKWTKHMTDHKYNHAAANDFTSHMAQSARKKFLVGGGVGLAAVGAKQLWDLNHQKQASDSDDNYSPHYVRNAVLTGGALATPDMARAYSSTAQGLDHRETFHEHSALSKRYLAEGDLINAAKYADSANTHKALAHQAELYTHNLGGSIGKRFAAGAALATAATGVNHIMHSGQTKSASLKAILQALETC